AYKFPLNPVAYAYRRALQVKTGPFPEDNHYAMDYWFILRAFLFGEVVKKEMIFGTFYFDGTNKSADDVRGRKALRSVKNNFVRRYFYHPKVARSVIETGLSSLILGFKKLSFVSYRKIADLFRAQS